MSILKEITNNTMEKLSRCCGAKRKVFDNWASTNDRDDVRFSYVCSECGKDFVEQKNETIKS